MIGIVNVSISVNGADCYSCTDADWGARTGTDTVTGSTLTTVRVPLL